MAKRLTLVIADDHPLMLQALRQTLESAGFEVLGEAHDGRTALDMILRMGPDIAVLDIAMPRLDGFGVVREIQKRRLHVKTVFLTANPDEALFDEAVEQGVRGYLLKESASGDIVSAIRIVAEGHRYASPALTTYAADRSRTKAAPRASEIASLSPAEMRVLRLVADYKTTKEIAEELFISPLTVETHRRNICEKLALRGSNAVIKFALAHRDVLK
jgi:DNA-binding NarL/FixJ family response regulator